VEGVAGSGFEERYEEMPPVSVFAFEVFSVFSVQ
jgi:hypothetical protein